MTYWHMQLHPKDDLNWNKEEELLNGKGLIGIDSEIPHSQRVQFTDGMQIGDIVLIKRGISPIALVEVAGESEVQTPSNDIIWFSLQRKIKILGWASGTESNFKLPAVRLSKSVNKDSKVYQLIDNLYLSTQQKQYHQESLVADEYKISNIFIDDFKMFKNFTLNLVGTDKKPLPLIVLAGKNGTGKTSILEYLSDYNLNEGDYIEIFKTKKNEIITVESFKLFKSMAGILEKKSEYKNHILYLPVQIGDTDNVEERIAEHYKKKAKEYDSFKKSLVELQTYMDTIFKDLELTFKISDVDDDKKKVFFKNTNGEIFGAEALSTGEKTLLSKVLYLYFSELKNKIILIDEPELSLHPSWQNRVLKLYENFAIKNNCQIIIATHSPHIIGSAKNEYIRVLRRNGSGQIEVIDDILAYGRDIAWVLEEVMGTQFTRDQHIVNKIKECQDFLNDGKYDEAEECINNLEIVIGKDDSEVMHLRNSLFFERD
jgi:predicted ATP-binding protein involved in virulence